MFNCNLENGSHRSLSHVKTTAARLLSVALSGGRGGCKALQQKRLHREPGRASLLSGPHVQPRRLDAALQTHIKPGAQQKLL